jgi:hypothetical protein
LTSDICFRTIRCAETTPFSIPKIPLMYEDFCVAT